MDRSGIFTATLFDARGTVLGSMQGSAQTVSGGQTSTVEFVSQDPYVAFDHCEFQTDTSYDG